MRLGDLISRIKTLGARDDLAIQEPYVYRPTPAPLSYDDAVAAIARKGFDVRRGGVANPSEELLDRLTIELAVYGIHVEDYLVDVDEYRRYIEDADYLDRHRDYYWFNRAEKMLEHFLAFKELAPSKRDVFIDVASEDSPVPEIYARLSAANCYAQDIQYPPGLSVGKIGGDACAMPVPDAFASRAALTCSLEHFEGDGDTRLFAELSRIIAPGGKLIVAPLYMAAVDSTQTDPLCSAAANVRFDEGSIIHCAEGWGNRHARFYSARTLYQRLIAPFSGFRFRILRLRNYSDLPPDIYLRLFMLCSRC